MMPWSNSKGITSAKLSKKSSSGNVSARDVPPMSMA